MTKTVLVTGGAGYVGSHVCKALATAGFEPVTYDNLSRGFEKLVRWGPLERGDINDRTRLDEVMEKYRPAAVCHMAAYAYVGESTEDPAIYYRNNIAGSLTLAEAAVAAKINAFVFSSSCTIYGIPETSPVGEDLPITPISPYGVSKATVEAMLRDFDPAYGLKSVCLRYFNAAGADPDGETGECHDPETHAIPLAIRACLKGERFKVFGTDYDTADGTAIRDYIHVTDLADAHVRAISYLLEGGESTAFNLGTGRGTSVKELLEAVEEVMGKPLPYDLGPRRAGDASQLFASNKRAVDILGWDPKFMTIREIIETAAKWHREND